ncbi:MAG: glycosyltransferase, partial [Planctomycetota bacterium]
MASAVATENGPVALRLIPGLALWLSVVKILHVGHGYLPESAGGVELYLRDLLAAQMEAGHDVALLSGSLQIWEKAGLEEAQVEGIRVFRLHRQDSFFDHYAHGFNLDAEKMIVDVLGREQPDVVHVHQWIRLTSNIVALAEAQDIPAVVTLHDVHTSCPRTFRVHR